MSRQIKFRVWNKKLKKMTTKVWPSMSQFETEDKEHVYMQFTGLNKNGKEIWEGDMMQAPGDKKMYIIWRVEFQEGIFWLVNSRQDDDRMAVRQVNTGDCKLEVIGNIWENGELLNDNK